MQFSVSVASPAAQIVHKVLAQDKGDKSGSAKATWREFILFLESFVFFSHFWIFLTLTQAKCLHLVISF